MDYFELIAKMDDLGRKVRDAYRAGDLYHAAAWRLERAWVEMQLRDLWGPWSPRGDHWSMWMWEDIRQAQQAADQLARRIGDSNLECRLLTPFPRLAGALAASA